MIEIFMGKGWWIDGGGGSSEGYLKWGRGGSLRDLSKNISKQGVGPRGHFTVKKTGGLAR